MPEARIAGSTVIPGMLYRNAPDAIEWLCHVFGFTKHTVHPGPGNTIMHAELTLGAGMIMLGSVHDRAPERHMKLPSELGGAQTRGVSLTVADADEIYARAKAAGAKIIEEIEDKPYGGRGFACLDPEGHIWHVGTYDPWTARP
jgi:uncharacterized glyoxalase superfamily protein PhnB